jgi:hypothetical protein
MGVRTSALVILLNCRLESPIQINEITQPADTNSKMAAINLCPLASLATQREFKVAILQTPSVSRVEIAIL